MTLVVKLGSSIVAADDGSIRTGVLDSVCSQAATLRRAGEPLPDRAAAQAMGLTEGYRGAIRPHECDADGVMRPDVIIARIWDGVPNLRNRGSGLGIKEEGMGSAALEYRVAQFRPLLAGQLLTVCSGLKALGDKTTTWTHLVHDGETGEVVAAAEAVGIAFDLKARKAVPIPDERRAALTALLVPGLGL